MKFDYKKLFVFESPRPGRTILPVPYTKTEDNYRFYSSKNDFDHISYLSGISASSKVGDTFLRYEADNIIVYVSFGDQSKYEKEMQVYNISMAGAHCYKAVSYLNEHLNFYLELDEWEREFVCGIILSSYKYEFNKKNKKKDTSLSVIGNVNIKNLVTIYNCQNFARFLGDTPANQMTPIKFVEYAKDFLNEQENITIKVLGKEEMSQLNMNLLLSVAQGSVQEPKLLHISYKGRGDDNVDVGLVGKGITFDSGGISLKPSANMSAMKGDMLGGASVLAVMRLVSEFQLQANVKAVIPLTENLPSGSATKPGDVFCGMIGKSVEVDNTDAEGRLILADALSYIQQYKPEYVLDMATLTGAMAISLGDSFIGFFSNDDDLAEIIYQSGFNSADPTWRLPLSSLYLSSMKSLVADIKNVGGRQGGSAIAAIFLKEFVDDKTKWAHFDIAGVMDSSNNSSVYGKYMTGKGVPVMFETVKRIIQEKK